MVKVINCAPDPHIGESKTLSFLKQRLEVGYHVILTNYYLRDRNGTLEIDLVVINRFGVWLLEVKDWYGRIKADDIFWQQEGMRPVSSPITSIDRKAKVMHSYLAEQSKGMGRVSVTGLVVLARGTSMLEISDPRRDRVLALDERLVGALTSERFQFRPSPPLGRRDIDRLRDMVVRDHVNPDRQFIGSYRVLREIRREAGLTEYEAEHTEIQGRKARIKVFQVAEIVGRKSSRMRCC
jgi:hypothetical protein